MNLIVVEIGDARFAFAEQQVAQIAPWSPAATGRAAIPLTTALSLSEVPCERALRVPLPEGGWVDFGVPASISQSAAEPTSLTRVPSLLRRLHAPAWVAGFFRGGGRVATVIDLRALAQSLALGPDPKRRTSAP